MSDPNFTGPEFVVGSAKGIRVWRTDSLGRLTGWTHREVWTPGENVARCRKGEVDTYTRLSIYYGLDGERAEPCESIDPACACGYWAYHSGTPDFGSSEGVVGIIEGYGKTTIGTKGFRCEKARILAFAFPKSLCGCSHDLPFAQTSEVEATVRCNYPDVPTFDSVDDMVAAFPPDKPELPSPDDPDFWTMPDPARKSASPILRSFAPNVTAGPSLSFHANYSNGLLQALQDAHPHPAETADDHVAPEPRRRWWQW